MLTDTIYFFISRQFKYCRLLLILIVANVSNVVIAADKPFVMVYSPNYTGYNNRNTSTDEDEQGNPCNDPGYYIAQAPYNVPGIQEDANYVGFPACNGSAYDGSDEYGKHDGTTENQHFTDMLEGVTAIAYGFLLPENDGIVTFSDPWADQQLADYDSGGLCDMTVEGSQVCYFDDSKGADGIAEEFDHSEDQNGWGSVNYGSVDAFTALQNSTNTLEHYGAIGGWTYRTYMDRLVSSDSSTISATNVQNFEKVVAHLVEHGFDGIDLDIEFDDASTGYADSLLFQALTDTGDGKGLIEQLKSYVLAATGKTVALSVTIQANPAMLQFLMGNDASGVQHIHSWFTQGLDHLNLMTYDDHGVYEFNSENENYTGFNSTLFSYNSGTYVDPFNKYTNPVTGEAADFSVDSAIQYLNGFDGAESDNVAGWYTLTDEELGKVNIGLAAYGRGMTDITVDKDTDPNGTGLYQFIKTASAFPGDQDPTSCSLDLSSADACNGMFSYNYILNDMLTSGFTSTDWAYHDDISGKDFSIASTMFNANAWTPVTSTTVFDTANNVTAVGASTAYPASVTNSFVAYTSAKVADSYGYYAKNRKLGGVIMWTINGDVSYKDDPTHSLIYNFQQGYAEASTASTATE